MIIPAYIVLGLLLLAGLGSRVVVIVGAARMLQGRSYRLVKATGILAMIPCSPLWLASLPLGIWTLLLVRRQDAGASAASGGEVRRRRVFVWTIIAIAITASLLLATFCAWYLLSTASTRPPPSGSGQKSHPGRRWVVGPDGPTLTPEFATFLSVDPRQIERVNRVLQSCDREYHVLERKHTQERVADNGHLIITMRLPSKDLAQLVDRFWSEMDSILNRQQQAKLRSLYSSPSNPLATDWASNVYIELWRVGSWYHWTVNRPGSFHSSSGPELPVELRPFWKEPDKERSPPSLSPKSP